LLTFARGGVASVVVAVFLALVVLAPRFRRAWRPALPVILAFAVACGAILLVVNTFSGGKLIARYDEKIFTRRDSIIGHDLDLFREHPLFGVGVGVAATERPREIRGEPAHTEFTRLLAEQGLFGAVALAAFLTIVVGAVWRARPLAPRAFAAALVGWSVTQMLHSATRIALVSYAVGLAIAASGLVADDTGPKDEPTPPRRGAPRRPRALAGQTSDRLG
jgi:O-antigen ligase